MGCERLDARSGLACRASPRTPASVSEVASKVKATFNLHLTIEDSLELR